MNVVPLLKHNAVEETLFTAYDTIEDKNAASDAAIAALKSNGLPTRRVEAWHYTDLRSHLKMVPSALISGKQSPVETLLGGPVTGIGDGFHGGLSAVFEPADAIGHLNTAFASEGVSLTVSGSDNEPVEFQTSVSDGANHSRNSVTFEAGASGTIIERQLGAAGFATSVTDLTVGDNAEATYVIVQEKDTASTHLGQINITVGSDANLMLFILNAGGQLVRQEVNVDVKGEGSDFQLRGVNLIGDKQHIDVTMDLGHVVPHTTSEEIIRNVVVGNGHGIFQGKIRVTKIAQKTDAKMACNTLLLSDDGNFSTKPELEIFADDVACGHGATFTDIEPSYMFYLMSRGIPEREARALLIKGFVDEIVEDLENEPLEEALVSIIDTWLDAHG